MPHFYFDLVNDKPIHDRYGIKLPDLDAARDHAQKMADKLKRQRKRPEDSYTKIVVKDNKFKLVLSVPLKSSN